MADRRRVVVTGIGLVSSLGIGTEANWLALTAGQSGVTTITKFDPTEFSTRIAGEVKNFDPLAFIEKKDVKKMDIFIQYAIAASQFAVDDACLTFTPEEAPRVGVFIASGIGGFTTIEREHKALLKGGPRKISPFFIPSAIINLAAGQVSIRFGAKGPNLATCTACSASAHALGDAYELILRGAADVMIAGGSEAAITPMGVGGFAALRALSTRNDDPERASRPFDHDRDGFIVGEGSGMLILEELRAGEARAAPGSTPRSSATACRPMRITSRRRRKTATARYRVMGAAMESAGIQPSQVDYINAHGTSTPHGDRVETIAIKRCFGEHAREARGLVDQVDDRASAGRGRRPRGRHHGARRLQPAGAADDQPRPARRGMRPRLRPQRQAGDEDRVRAVELVRLRRHQRGAAVSGASIRERHASATNLVIWSSGHCRWNI